MGKGRLVGLCSLIAVAGLLAAACGSSGGNKSSHGATSAPYVIGMSNDLSGPIAPLGQQGLAGMQTYIDYLNANGGVNGRKIDFISLDDQSNPALGRSDYQELAEKKALVMFGCVYTAVCQAAAPLVSQYKVPIVSEGGPDNDLFPAKPYLYSNDLAQGLQPIVMVDEVAALAKAAGITKVRLAWIGANTASDLDGVTTLKNMVKARPGWSMVGVQLLPLSVTNAAPEAQALAADKPNFIIGVHNDANIIPTVQALRAAGVTAPVINVTAGSADATFQALKGNFIAWRTYVSPTQTDIPAVVTMRQRATKYGELKQATGSYFTQGYVAGLLVQAALEKCGANCDTGVEFNTALQKLTSFDADGLSAAPLGFSPTRHVLNLSAWFFQWSTSQNKVVAISPPLVVSPAQIKQFG
jgi:ABC-type branched-subunit amino acid transport system substrate-binding protein